LDRVIVRIMRVDLRDEIRLPIERGWPQDNGVNGRRLISFWRFTGSRCAARDGQRDDR